MKRTARTLIVVIFAALLLPATAHAQSPQSTVHRSWIVAGAQIAGVELERQVAVVVEAQRVADYVAAVIAEQERQAAAAAYAASQDGRIDALGVNWAREEALHRCEQGDNWYADGYNAADPGHQRFQGGLGMSTVAWQIAVSQAAARGIQLPPSALQASPRLQMVGSHLARLAGVWWACRV